MLIPFRSRLAACALASLLTLPQVEAKPNAFANGTTAMAEYGAGTMEELQVFYAPTHRMSFGGGYLRLDSDEIDRTRNIAYGRANFLLRRWNMEAAQGNVFAWGSLGGGSGNDFEGETFVWNAGAQADYETRRVYSSLKTEYYDSSDFTHRIDTLQLGWAPYPHDYDRVATWFVVQGRHYTGELHDGVEWALLLRLFKGGTWVEAGATTDGNLQAMIMFNF